MSLFNKFQDDVIQAYRSTPEYAELASVHARLMDATRDGADELRAIHWDAVIRAHAVYIAARDAAIDELRREHPEVIDGLLASVRRAGLILKALLPPDVAYTPIASMMLLA